MHIELHNKTAIISGSTAGIGFAIAKGLAEAGATVILNGRTQVAVDKALAALVQAVPAAKVRGVAADLGTAAGCTVMLKTEPLADILVNNLGIYEMKDFFDIDDAEWEHFFQVNVMSGVRLSRAYAKGMAASQWGRIVFISSESGLNIPPDMLHYGFTKTANLSISRGLAKRLAGTGVTVNAVLPGPTQTEGLEAAFSGKIKTTGQSIEQVTADFIREKRPSSIIQRFASVEEVASMVVYVCSKQASATTGAALRVDGGTVDTIA